MNQREKFVARFGGDNVNTSVFPRALEIHLSSVLVGKHTARQQRSYSATTKIVTARQQSLDGPIACAIRRGPRSKVRWQWHVGKNAAF